MKRILIVFMMVLPLFLLVGCSENNTFDIEDLDGRYYYEECIYLSPLLSVTKDFHTQEFAGVIYIEFSENQIVFYSVHDPETTYEEIEFIEEDIEKDLDEILSYDFDSVFDTFDTRYDIYSDGTSVGLSIFIDDETVYLAETSWVGNESDVFHIWSIYEIQK